VVGYDVVVASVFPLLSDGRHIDYGEATTPSLSGSDTRFTPGKQRRLHAREGSMPSPWGSHHTFTDEKRRNQVRSFHTHANPFN
jgi:hypothetical protein